MGFTRKDMANLLIGLYDGDTELSKHGTGYLKEAGKAFDKFVDEIYEALPVEQRPHRNYGLSKTDLEAFINELNDQGKTLDEMPFAQRRLAYLTFKGMEEEIYASFNDKETLRIEQELTGEKNPAGILAQEIPATNFIN